MRALTVRRAAPAVLIALGLVLTGCGSDENDADAKATDSASNSSTGLKDEDLSCSDLKSGSVSDKVKVTGTFGEETKATFETPLKADGIQQTILTKGTKPVPKTDEQVDFVFSIYRGSDGESLGGQASSLRVGEGNQPFVLRAGAECVPVGTRSVLVVPASVLFGDQGNPSAGIDKDETLVLVTDLVGKKKPITPAAWTTNVPKVTFAADGTPTVTIPKVAASPKLVLKRLRDGEGQTVKAGDNVTVNYLGLIWDTSKKFDSSYDRGEPATFATGGVVPGFGAALVGQKVGTRLIVSIPPALGYGSGGNEGAGIKGTDTLVFVVEITATASQ